MPALVNKLVATKNPLLITHLLAFSARLVLTDATQLLNYLGGSSASGMITCSAFQVFKCTVLIADWSSSNICWWNDGSQLRKVWGAGGDSRIALDALLQTWTERQSEIQGSQEIKVSIAALSSLLASRHPALNSIQVPSSPKPLHRVKGRP